LIKLKSFNRNVLQEGRRLSFKIFYYFYRKFFYQFYKKALLVDFIVKYEAKQAEILAKKKKKFKKIFVSYY